MHQKIIICETITSYKKNIKICLIFTKEIVFVDVSQTCSGITIIAWRQPQNIDFSYCALTNAPGMVKSPCPGLYSSICNSICSTKLEKDSEKI